MIHEIAILEIKPGTEDDFELAFAKAGPIFQRAKGCRSMEIQRCIEHPSRYTLVVGWDTVEDHMVGFRESADFLAWRELAGPYFASAPQVTHTRLAARNF